MDKREETKFEIVTGDPPEKPGGKYCNLEPIKCKKYGRVYADDGGYICAWCGKRVSKWLPVAHVLSGKKTKEPIEVPKDPNKAIYDIEWGNYKSDKHKTKKTLKVQIRDILSYGTFTKKELMRIKEILETVGFKHTNDRIEKVDIWQKIIYKG